ncbi:hypothetical protein [Azorhizobium sp. AG788]|uniref:hypothetical protein n=1 Tax=Azorhizobium sp. AG788 TaxID=2183897 RepID=UPI0031399A14
MSLPSSSDAVVALPLPAPARMTMAALAPQDTDSLKAVHDMPSVSPFTKTSATLVGGAWIAATVLVCLLLRARPLKRP